MHLCLDIAYQYLKVFFIHYLMLTTEFHSVIKIKNWTLELRI